MMNYISSGVLTIETILASDYIMKRRFDLFYEGQKMIENCYIKYRRKVIPNNWLKLHHEPMRRRGT